MTKEKSEISKKFIEFQLIQENMKQIQQQIINVETQVLELKNIQDSLEDIRKVKKDKDISPYRRAK